MLKIAIQIFRYLWASPATALGLIFLPFSGRGVAVVDGVIEIHGGLANWFLKHGTLLQGGASAMTLGHVVIARDLQQLERTRAHERIHVRQYERWGPFFIPTYIGVSIYLSLRGRDAYRDNFFEREAFSNS